MLCTHSTEKLLGLKEVIVKNVKQFPERTEIEIELPRKPHICPCCGSQTDCVHDYRRQLVKDLPAFDKHTVLILRKRRYCCSNCGKALLGKKSFPAPVLPHDKATDCRYFGQTLRCTLLHQRCKGSKSFHFNRYPRV